MRPVRPPLPPAPHGDTLLSVLLVATLLAPLPAALWGASLPPVLGMSRGALLLAAVALAAGWVAWSARRDGTRGARGAAMTVALTAALSAALARVIERRASRFYTEEALFEGVAILLGLHAAGGALRVAARARAREHVRAARHGRVRTWWRRSRGAPVTAAELAGVATDGVVLLVGAAWACTALNARDVAFALMLVAGVTQLLVVVLRLPDAARALPRWIAPVALALALAACAVPRTGVRLPALARDRAGPGCGVQRVDTTPLPTLVARAVAPRRPAPASPGALALRLNIPAYRVDVVRDSAVVASYGVAVGMRRYRTPTGAFAVHRIVWNPWWVPPKSEWARKDTVTPPGPTNPMGRVKLLLGGPYYMHGTPFEASIGSAASHGCLRMRQADAIALALRLQAHAGLGPGDSALASILADTVSVAVDLPQPVPVDIGYEVAELRGDSLLLHPDVYRRAAGRTHEAAMRVLLAASHDTTQVRRRVLAAAVRRARSRHVAVPLDSLMLNSTPDTPTIARVQ